MNTILLATPDADSTRRIFLRNAGLFGLGLAAAAPLLVPTRALAASYRCHCWRRARSRPREHRRLLVSCLFLWQCWQLKRYRFLQQ